MAVTYVGSGVFSAVTGTGVVATPGYPTGLASGDLLIIQVAIKATSATSASAVPDGFALLGGGYSSGTHGHGGHYLYKWSDGTETGTVTVTPAGGASSGTYARMSAFRGVGGSPGVPTWEGNAFAGVASSTLSHPAMTSTVADALGVAYHTNGHDEYVNGALAGATGGTWVHQYSSVTGVGNDGAIYLNTVDMAGPTTVSGGTVTIAGTLRWTRFTFILLPSVAAAASSSLSQVIII